MTLRAGQAADGQVADGALPVGSGSLPAPAPDTAGAGGPDDRGVPARISLRRRVAMLSAFGVGLVVALVSVAAFFTVRSALYSQLDQNLVQRATAAAQGPLANPGALAQIPSEALGAGDLRIAILYASGIAHSSAGRQSAPPLGRPELAVARGTTNVPSLRTATAHRVRYRVVAVDAGEGRALVLAQQLRPTELTLDRLGLVLALVGGVGIVLAALAGTAVARAGLRPVQRLTAAAERVAATGDLEPIPVTGGDELARLTQSFNAMLTALATSRERQRQLVADAGHELRTPLTSLRTNLELLVASNQPGAPVLSDADRAEIQADLRAQVDELTTLVGDVVELARDDPPSSSAERLDLSDIVERTLERARRHAPGLRYDLRSVPWTIWGDADALERAVLNLLDNAAKWSPPGGTVRVELRPLDDGSAVLEVADAGPGIPDVDLTYVFDRFYRSLSARSLPGSGLGLAIVKQVAERHGGSVWAGRAPEGGALLAMLLPGG